MAVPQPNTLPWAYCGIPNMPQVNVPNLTKGEPIRDRIAELCYGRNTKGGGEVSPTRL